jgi:hypothetical protein
VGWSISFDNIGERFEYVRHGADWQLQLHNLDLIQEFNQQSHRHGGGIHAVYNLYNATRLVEFKQFAQDQIMTIKWQLWVGLPLNPRNYGHEIAKLAMDEIERMFNTCATNGEEKIYFGEAHEHYQQQLDSNPTALGDLKNS